MTCTPAEFDAISKAWNEECERRERGAWERLRTLAAITIQPHLTKKITPRKLLPLPWDNNRPKREAAETEQLSAEERQKRFEDLRSLIEGS